MKTKSNAVPGVGSWDGGDTTAGGGRGREKKPKNGETQLKPRV